MDHKTQIIFRQLINDKRREALAELGFIEDTMAVSNSFDHNNDAVCQCFTDPADQCRDHLARERAFASACRESDILRELDHALERVDADTYGICDECNKPIPEARLRVIPHARQCVECQGKNELRRT